MASTSVRPPSLKPSAVRGAIDVSRPGTTLPPDTTVPPLPSANRIRLAASPDSAYESVTGSPGASARSAVAAAPRPTSTKPSAGIAPAPAGPVGATETTLPPSTTTSAIRATSTPVKPRLRL